MAYPLNSSWTTPALNATHISCLENELGIGTLLATTLVARGFETPDQARAFLDASFEDDWGEADGLSGISAAADRIEQAIRLKKRILIFGDYDVDGLTSTALLSKALGEFGVMSDTLIPNRLDEGYGLSKASVNRILSHNPEVVITVDCGISAYEEVLELTRSGIEVIVTDHHEPSTAIPCNVPVCNPKLDPDGPGTTLAGVGVVLKLVEILSRRFNRAELWRSFTDYAALGTLADLMPLLGENRALVRDGFTRMKEMLRPGLAALHAACRLPYNSLTTTDLVYSFIPRLNAAGRMGDAQLSLDLLLSDDVPTSFDLAEQLDALNTERRAIERGLYELADRQASQYPKDARVLILADIEWHEGVKGIVASRIAHSYGVPTIIFSIEDDVARGSGRSVGLINLFDAVEQCADFLIRFGGHGSAVGVTINADALPVFQSRLEEIISQEPQERFRPPLLVDARCKLSSITVGQVQELDMLEPYGQANPEPLYIVENVFITRARTVGADSKHLSFMASDGHTEMGSIWFNCPDADYFLNVRHVVDIVFTPKIEVWNAKASIKLHVKAVFEKSNTDTCDDILVKAPVAEPIGSAQKDASIRSCQDRHVFADAFIATAVDATAQLHTAQRLALDALADGKNTLVVMATGRGKSLIFQIHTANLALAAKQASILVFPLRALINDQALHLTSLLSAFGLKAIRLTGEVRGNERNAAYEAFVSGQADIVLTTPEFLELHAHELASLRPVGFIVIDEAHHIATSSSQYRSPYTRLNNILLNFPQAKVLALSATADAAVADMICKDLRIDTVITDPTERPNLSLVDYRNIKAREQALASIIASGEKSLVYARTRVEALQLTRALRKLVPMAAPRIVFYHAGLNETDRLAIEHAFRKGDVTCIICTSAFGEGVNIPDIRHVILYHLPFSLIDFNQFAGRGGRDGAPTQIILAFNMDDALQNGRILNSKAPSRDDLAIVWRSLKEIGYDSFEIPESVSGESDETCPFLSSLHQRCTSAKVPFYLDIQGLLTALKIFEDIGLLRLELHDGGVRYFIIEPNEKADLSKSPLYLEGVTEQAAFETFRSWVMDASPQDILSMINRPLTPENNTCNDLMKDI